MHVWDDNGNTGSTSTVLFGAYAGVVAGATLTYQYTTADTINQLSEWSWTGGFSGGALIGGAGEYIRGVTYWGTDVSAGIGIPGVAGYSLAGYTWVTKL
jgi:hypothetical protein